MNQPEAARAADVGSAASAAGRSGGTEGVEPHGEDARGASDSSDGDRSTDTRPMDADGGAGSVAPADSEATPAGSVAPADSEATPAGSALSTAPDGPLLWRLNQRGFRLVMLADILALLFVMLGTMFVRFGLSWPTYPVTTYLASFAVAGAVFIASLYFGGLYEREPRLGAPSPLPRAARQTLGAAGLVALLNLAVTGIAREAGFTTARALPFPIVNLLVLIVLGAVAITVNRWLVHLQRTRREGPPKVVLAGTDEDREVARLHLAADRGRTHVVAEVSDPSAVLRAVRAAGATDVMVVSSGWIDDLYPEQAEALDREQVPVLLRVSARETLFGLERVREVGGLPFVLLRTQTVPRSRARFKRVFDVTMLVLLAPVGVVTVGAVALYQLVLVGRPLLYRQERVGVGGRTFEMVKFRTMVVDAEADGQGARLAAARDARVVPGCHWIRSARLDELPQLWNVIRGEMSLVGPRPERPELTEEFEARIPGYARRHELPPGMTGLAQIHGRYHTDPEYKLGYDLQYLVNWSPVLDLDILIRTIWVVVARRV